MTHDKSLAKMSNIVAVISLSLFGGASSGRGVDVKPNVRVASVGSTIVGQICSRVVKAKGKFFCKRRSWEWAKTELPSLDL